MTKEKLAAEDENVGPNTEVRLEALRRGECSAQQTEGAAPSAQDPRVLL